MNSSGIINDPQDNSGPRAPPRGQSLQHTPLGQNSSYRQLTSEDTMLHALEVPSGYQNSEGSVPRSEFLLPPNGRIFSHLEALTSAVPHLHARSTVYPSQQPPQTSGDSFALAQLSKRPLTRSVRTIDNPHNQQPTGLDQDITHLRSSMSCSSTHDFAPTSATVSMSLDPSGHLDHQLRSTADLLPVRLPTSPGFMVRISGEGNTGVTMGEPATSQPAFFAKATDNSTTLPNGCHRDQRQSGTTSGASASTVTVTERQLNEILSYLDGRLMGRNGIKTFTVRVLDNHPSIPELQSLDSELRVILQKIQASTDLNHRRVIHVHYAVRFIRREFLRHNRIESIKLRNIKGSKFLTIASPRLQRLPSFNLCPSPYTIIGSLSLQKERHDILQRLAQDTADQLALNQEQVQHALFLPQTMLLIIDRINLLTKYRYAEHQQLSAQQSATQLYQQSTQPEASASLVRIATPNLMSAIMPNSFGVQMQQSSVNVGSDRPGALAQGVQHLHPRLAQAAQKSQNNTLPTAPAPNMSQPIALQGSQTLWTNQLESMPGHIIQRLRMNAPQIVTQNNQMAATQPQRIQCVAPQQYQRRSQPSAAVHILNSSLSGSLQLTPAQRHNMLIQMQDQRKRQRERQRERDDRESSSGIGALGEQSIFSA